VCAETELLTHSSSIDTEARELHQPTKAGNLTATDTVLPVDLVQKYWAVVESKRTDAVTLKGKARSQCVAADHGRVQHCECCKTKQPK